MDREAPNSKLIFIRAELNFSCTAVPVTSARALAYLLS